MTPILTQREIRKLRRLHFTDGCFVSFGQGKDGRPVGYVAIDDDGDALRAGKAYFESLLETAALAAVDDEPSPTDRHPYDDGPDANDADEG